MSEEAAGGGRGAAGGFTLLEVLVALSILAIVLVSTYATVLQTRTSIAAAEAAVEGSEVGEQAVALYAALLESAFFRPDRPDLALVGWSSGRDERAADGIRLVSAAGHVLALPGPPGDLLLCKLELRVERDGRRLLVLEAGASGPAVTEPAAAAFVLSTEIDALDLSFLTPRGWAEAYDSGVWKGLPAAVRIRVWKGGRIVAARTLSLPLAAAYPARDERQR
jgi:prepilin-type N-terminal cleavage/methylation domain-containing protein